MIKLLRADFARLRRSFAIRLAVIGMLLLASAFMVMQATAMDYTVPLSRVVFLPMSMFGVAAGAFVSVFVGNDFADGFIRNKLLTADRRSGIVASQIIVSCVGCVIIYVVTTFFTAGLGRFFFKNDVAVTTFIEFFLIGLLMSLVTGCLFAAVSMLCGKKTNGVIWCMGLAFGMLFLSLHTNSKLVQTEYKDGTLNPYYLRGARRRVYELLHDFNPCGQAAQLTTWKIRSALSIILLDILFLALLCILCCKLFERKDIN